MNKDDVVKKTKVDASDADWRSNKLGYHFDTVLVEVKPGKVILTCLDSVITCPVCKTTKVIKEGDWCEDCGES
mgnify:CR=1 FL=1|tara:strand:- start:2329 stop:2547 length:219 start_codon:yes stop_codon:yes gene_type:complete